LTSSGETLQEKQTEEQPLPSLSCYVRL